MPYFDFHLHPSLKPQLSQPPAIPSPWDIVKIKFNHPNVITVLLKCSGINEVVDSQASLQQLIKGKVNLVTIALHPPESNMMKDGLINEIAAEEQTQYINLQRVRDISSGDIYFRMLNEELANLKAHLSRQGKKLKLIKKISEYKANDLDTIHAVFSVEGPHAFHGARQGKTETEIMTEFWQNFETFTAANRILSMNIAHLQDNLFCTHAFGIQIFKQEPFYPNGNGITHHGFRLLQKLKEKKILIDIKHTSLYARKQLYDYLLNDDDLPLVCTHAGLTGIEKTKRGIFFQHQESEGDHLKIRHYKPAGYIGGTSFNPNSINLYDEDVQQILLSGGVTGIIGLSLDQRILGVPDESMMGPDYFEDIYEEEVISPQEKDYFTNVHTGTPDSHDIHEVSDMTLEVRQDYPIFHARHFLNQVFHMFRIADKYSINKALVAKRICIGSDFDGLINPVDCCQNVTQYDSFKKLLLRNFGAWENEFADVSGYRVSDFISPADLLENIFYRNAVEFLQTWYK